MLNRARSLGFKSPGLARHIRGNYLRCFCWKLSVVKLSQRLVLQFLVGVLLALGLALTKVAVEAADAKPEWQLEWDKSVEAAKKEGKLSVYFWQGGNLEKVILAFQKKFPEIHVTTVGGRGSKFVVRLTSEQRAGKYLADVCMCGVTSPYEVLLKQAKALDPIKSAFLLPEVVDESKWWEGRHHFQDPEGQYIFAFWGRPSATRVSYNSTLVDPRDFKSYWDILNAKWKGKIVAIDPNESAGGWRALYYKPSVGAEFLKRLFGELDITVTREDRQAADWLATGKFALGLFVTGVPEARAQGLPVDEFRDANFKEPPSLDTGANGTIVLLKQAPHPNAVKVFINWFLSREGQSLYQEVMNTRFDYVESMREDIAKESIPAEYRRRRRVKYVNMFVPEHMDPAPLLKLYKDTMKR
jgi:ABC-type Fe3+ transport system substrate-binding protein